ncbi:MAG TPA: chemotaxis protein CheB [Desulfobacterales bacterium]
MNKPISVVVVDDAAFMRRAVSDILASDRQIRVVDTARNGKDALERVKSLQPDVITLDIDMPIMDGLTAIRHLMIESPVPIVVLSSLFSDGAITFDALRLGVVDFVPKPSGAVSEDIERSRRQIVDRVKIATAVNMENIRRVRLPRWNMKQQLNERYGFQPLDYLVAVGTSLGGPNTVIRLLTRLSPGLPAAMVAVQEISPRILGSFARKFDESVPWRVEAAVDGVALEQGTCYMASNQQSVRVEAANGGPPTLRVQDRIERPLDDLFASAARCFHRNAVGVLLTGLGDDGAEGLRKIRAASGVTIAQDAECCVYPNLTHHAIQSGVVDFVADENRMVRRIETLMR